MESVTPIRNILQLSIYKAVGLYVVCLCVCLRACISQVELSLPGTLDLVQPARKLDPLPSMACVSVCLSGYGDCIGREYRGMGLQRQGTTEVGTTEAGTTEAGDCGGKVLERWGLQRRRLQR